MKPHVGPDKRYSTALDAYVHSPWGKQQWMLHKHGNVPLVEHQRDMTPFQKAFLLMAADAHEPDPEEHKKSGISSSPSRSSTHTKTQQIF